MVVNFVKLLYILGIVGLIGAAAPTPIPGTGQPLAAATNNPVQYNFSSGTIISSSAVNSNGYKIYSDLNSLIAYMNSTTGVTSSYTCPSCITTVTVLSPITYSTSAPTAQGSTLNLGLGVVPTSNGGTGCTTQCFAALASANTYSAANTFSAALNANGPATFTSTQSNTGGLAVTESAASANALTVANSVMQGNFWTSGFSSLPSGTFGSANKGYAIGYNDASNSDTDFYNASVFTAPSTAPAFDFFEVNTTALPATKTTLLTLDKVGDASFTGTVSTLKGGDYPYDYSSGANASANEHLEHGQIAAMTGTTATLHFSVAPDCLVSSLGSGATATIKATSVTATLLTVPTNTNATVYFCIGY